MVVLACLQHKRGTNWIELIWSEILRVCGTMGTNQMVACIAWMDVWILESRDWVICLVEYVVLWSVGDDWRLISAADWLFFSGQCCTFAIIWVHVQVHQRRKFKSRFGQLVSLFRVRTEFKAPCSLWSSYSSPPLELNWFVHVLGIGGIFIQG